MQNKAPPPEVIFLKVFQTNFEQICKYISFSQPAKSGRGLVAGGKSFICWTLNKHYFGSLCLSAHTQVSVYIYSHYSRAQPLVL